MNISIPKAAILSGFVGVLFAASASAQPGIDSFLEYRTYMQADPDEFYFFEDDSKQVASYNRDRVLRICVDDSRVVTPLRITFDDKTATVEAGDCMRVEGMDISLEPAEPLEQNTFLKVEVQTLN